MRGQRAIGPSAAPNADGDLVREMLAFAAEIPGLTPMLSRYPRQLPGGQR